MAFDEKIAKAVKDKYGVDVNGAGKWWECEALWKDPEFSEHFGAVYDDNIVKYVGRVYGSGVMRRWWEHKELFSDPVYGSYFVVLQRVGWCKICDMLNEPRPYRSTDSVPQSFLPDLSNKPGISIVKHVTVIER